jgi:hypothetical protein
MTERALPSLAVRTVPRPACHAISRRIHAGPLGPYLACHAKACSAVHTLHALPTGARLPRRSEPWLAVAQPTQTDREQPKPACHSPPSQPCLAEQRRTDPYLPDLTMQHPGEREHTPPRLTLPAVTGLALPQLTSQDGPDLACLAMPSQGTADRAEPTVPSLPRHTAPCHPRQVPPSRALPTRTSPAKRSLA